MFRSCMFKRVCIENTRCHGMSMENIYLVMYHDTIKFNIHSLHNEISHDFHLSKKINNHTYVSHLHIVIYK